MLLLFGSLIIMLIYNIVIFNLEGKEKYLLNFIMFCIFILIKELGLQLNSCICICMFCNFIYWAYKEGKFEEDFKNIIFSMIIYGILVMVLQCPIKNYYRSLIYIMLIFVLGYIVLFKITILSNENKKLYSEVDHYSRVFHEKFKNYNLGNIIERRSTVVIGDDNPVNINILSNMLDLGECYIIRAYDGLEVLDKLKTERKVDLIIINSSISKLSAYETCGIIREEYSKVDLPILMILSENKREYTKEVFEFGANDYINKPFDEKEILTKVKMLLTLKKSISKAIATYESFKEFKKIAVLDDLTLVYNRRYFFELAKQEHEKAKKQGHSLFIIMSDIDYFKKINDNYGHLFGDKVLKIIAQCCKNSIPEDAIIGRYGGEEFIIIISKVDLDYVKKVTENIRKNVERKEILFNKRTIVRVTISLGISQFVDKKCSFKTLIQNSDEALYEAKASGRNCYKVYKNK